MIARKLAVALVTLVVAGVFGSGLAAGRAWARVDATAGARTEERARLHALDEEIGALQQRLERHAESERQLAEQALDCRIATAYRHGGRRVELAQGQ
jgi:hypothetical protein